VVREFVRAAYGRAWAWAMLVTGLYGLLALALPEHQGAHLRLPELPEPVWWIIGAGVFILAPYLAYRQQRLSALHRPIIPRGLKLVVRQPSIDGSWRSFTPLAALLLLDVDPATPASERLASDAKSSPLPLSIEG
jgi:hypothetical protein